MKLRVIVNGFYDKKEDKYVYRKDEPVITRDEARAKELIDAKVCETIPEPEGMHPPEKNEEEKVKKTKKKTNNEN